MDPFQNLPEEIILPILRQLDFLGLYAIMSHSPRARLVVDLNLFSLTDDLLSACSTTSVDNYRWFYCTVLIHLPSPSSCYKTVDDLHSHRDNIISLKSLRSSQNEESLRYAIYTAIRTASQIQHLACACLWKLQHKFKAAIRPALDFRSRFEDSHDWNLPTDWENIVLSPPSWIEDFRVHRSLWCLQVFIDLRRAAGPEVIVSEDSASGSVAWGGWNWDTDKMDKIDDFVHCLRAFRLFDPDSVIRARDREISSVADTLEELGAVCLHVPPEEESLPEGYRPYRCPIFESLSILNIEEYPSWSPKPVPEEGYLPALWYQSPDDARCQSRQEREYDKMLQAFKNPTKLGERFALQKTRLFQRWGFFIWDSWRMWSLGLVEVLDRSENTEGVAREVMSPIHTRVNLYKIRKPEFFSRWCAMNQMHHRYYRCKQCREERERERKERERERE